MPSARKMCYDKILPQDMFRPQRMRSVEGRMRAIAPRDKRWVNGSTIRIRFLEGSDSQKDMVRQIAPEWTQHANLDFVFTDDPSAEIRVTFDPRDGAWSYVGTDNLHIPQNAATLNLGWQDEGVILHEFGHMIGLAHEHSNPVGGIQWNEEEVIRELAGPPNFWDEATVRHNVLRKYTADQILGTNFDPDSIMLYAFPAEWTLNGISTHENEKLSGQDEEFVRSAEMYPGRATPEEAAQPLGIGESIEAEISQAGEQDLYSLVADRPAVYTIETFGDTDTVVALYGPDSETHLVAENDDGGIGRNSLIQAELEMGKYFVQVRHYSEHRTGEYRITAFR